MKRGLRTYSAAVLRYVLLLLFFVTSQIRFYELSIGFHSQFLYEQKAR